MISITIPGIPHGKARPRFTGNGRPHTPPKTRAWEHKAKWCAKEVMRRMKPMTGPVSLSIIAVFPVPPSWPKWKQAAAYNDQLHHTTTPDGDNLVKAVSDAMNGIAWVDDAQVVSQLVEKRYGQDPSVYVSIYPIPGMCTQTKHKP